MQSRATFGSIHTMSCPKCRCPGGDILPNLTRRCGGCGYVYHEQLTFPQPPMARPMPKSAGKPQVVTVVVVAIVMLAGAGIAVAAFSDSDPPYARSDDPSPYRTGQGSTTRTAPRLRLELVGTLYGGPVNNKHWFLVEVKNVGDAPVGRPQVNTTIGGVRTYGFSDCELLEVGESTAFVCYWDAATFKDARFELSQPRSPSSRAKRLAIDEVKALPVSRPTQAPDVQVKVRNQHGKVAGDLELLVIGRDSGGRAVSVSREYIPSTEVLARGRSREFTVDTDVHRAAPATRFEAQAFCTLRD